MRKLKKIGFHAIKLLLKRVCLTSHSHKTERYSAMYPDPPKVSLDSAIQDGRWKMEMMEHRWKFGNDNVNPSMDQYDAIVEEWKSRDMKSTHQRLHSDWMMVMSSKKARKSIIWVDVKATMYEYYKPTENLTLKNFQFLSLSQD